MTGIALSLFFYSTIHVHYVLPDVTPPIMRLLVHVSVAWDGVGYYVLPIQCTICTHYRYYKAFKACAYYYQHNYYLINKE